MSFAAHTTFLTPGPSQLYFTVDGHLRQALRERVAEISHRSDTFRNMYRHAVEQLRELMHIPDTHYVVFTASATEAWERIIQNLSIESTYHLVNGSFSERFYDFAVLLRRTAVKLHEPEGHGFHLAQIKVPDATELICITHNETSTGVITPNETIYHLREEFPHALIALDMVSAAPCVHIDFTKVDTAFFSVQKCFGLPAGLCVWIFNDRCVQRAEAIVARGISLGTYHSIPALLNNAKKYETPETPNMLGIYLLGKVAEDMNRKGIRTLRQEIQYKSTLLYHALDKSKSFAPAVQTKAWQSPTVIVGEGEPKLVAEFLHHCETEHIVVGGGYGKQKASQFRIANFPTHSKEVMEKVADILTHW